MNKQKRKCGQIFRTNERKLDREIMNLKSLDSKTRNLILQASKRAQRNPSQAKAGAAADDFESHAAERQDAGQRGVRHAEDRGVD
jgi:hypothetical protein